MLDVRAYVGIPFRERGRDRSGCDCWGLVRLVLAERFALELPSLDGYTSVRDRERIGALIEDDLPAWIEVTGLERAGDVVLLAIAGRPLHVGLVVAPATMLHIERGIAACLERYDRLPWCRRVPGVYRHRAMAP
jgi:cell wall-associated NlpC family hydrolase